MLYIQIGIKLHFSDFELSSIYHCYYGYCGIMIYIKKYVFGVHPGS